MFHFEKKDIFRFKVLGMLSLILFFVILFIFGVKYYFSQSIVDNWESISSEKKKEIHADCLNIFHNYQNQTSQFSYQLLMNKKLISALTSYNTRKSYDALYEIENPGEYNIEFYNSRLELYIYSGRQIFPDILELKKALSGERYSIVKETGIYTNIVVLDPVKNENGSIEGVLVVSKILDVNSGVQSAFFNSSGIKKEIYEKLKMKKTGWSSSSSPGIYTRETLIGFRL